MRKTLLYQVEEEVGAWCCCSDFALERVGMGWKKESKKNGVIEPAFGLACGALRLDLLL